MQNVVITGGSSGLGKAMAVEFQRRNHNVLIAGRRLSTLQETRRVIGSGCHICVCDVRERVHVERLGAYADTLFQKTGGVHHWINNAAVCEGPSCFGELGTEDVFDILATNVLGTAYGFLVAQRIGAKNIYSISGHGSNGAPTKDFTLYGSSKAAVSQLTKTLVQELSPSGVNVRVIAPGIMRTALTERLLKDDRTNAFVRMVLATLSADPEDVAKKVVPKILSYKGSGGIIRG